jgi:hypothetical protein
MALLDVSELMTDPDFVMNFSIVRRTPTVNQYGENELTVVSTDTAVGSIQAATGEVAKRLPDGVQLDKFKTVFTKSVIRADASGSYPDQIIYKGQTYNVFKVYPWEDFGDGWYMVDIELENKSL